MARPAPRTRVAALVVLASVVLAADVSAQSGTTYDLTPYASSQPVLVEAYRALNAGDVSGDLLTRVRAASAASVDPLDRALADFLAAGLELVGPLADRTSLSAIITANGTFADDARELLADRSGTREAARLRLEIAPHVPAFRRHMDASVAALERAGDHDAALALLNRAYERSMASYLRTKVDAARSRLIPYLADQREASQKLRRRWWASSDERVVRAAKETLRARKLSIRRSERVAKRVLQATADNAKQHAKGLRKHRVKGRTLKVVYQWAAATLKRFGDGAAQKAAARKLKRLASRMKGKRFEPYFVFGQALVDQARGAVDEAAGHYQRLVAGWPRHHLAPDALSRLSAMLDVDDPRAATAFAAVAATDGRHDADHREALWRLGFAAYRAGSYSRAEELLARLERDYGGERNGNGAVWGARARYWRARVADKRGATSVGDSYRANLRNRFPLSWYARLVDARQTVPYPAGPGPHAARSAVADPAVAWLRLGDIGRGTKRLEAAFKSDMLPGTGRELLMHLYTVSGNPSGVEKLARAKEVLTKIPAISPPPAWFQKFYPFPYPNEVREAGVNAGVPALLMAAIAATETRFNPTARSRSGARGLCQLMPKTGRYWGKKVYGAGYRASDLNDPGKNLRIGAAFLADLRSRFGTFVAAVVGYNSGSAALRRWRKASGTTTPLDEAVELITYRQARRYVKRVFALTEVYRRVYMPDQPPYPLPRALFGP